MTNFSGVQVSNGSWASIWRCYTLFKVQHFLWRCYHHALPTAVSLITRGCGVSSLCPHCGSQEETVMHLLFLCPHSLQAAAASSDSAGILSLISFCAWGIWKARNHLVFEGVLWEPYLVVERAVASFWEFQEARSHCSAFHPVSTSPLVGSWIAPPIAQVKCNFDASFCRGLSLGGGGAIFRDFRCMVLQAIIFTQFRASSALSLESLTRQRVVFWASNLGFTCVWFESDAKAIVEGVLNEAVSPSEIASLCYDIRRDLQLF
ncbi:uncharacterized protein LOC132281608 [Cornus florida]|uniref:uncharacterized protein LOC132281608 n=1 Tax=Cornus florida TaxID=4283 RepID=UPI00289EB236|nr:uncharacterized protein LOC132281608 [Cornus florida]